MRSLVYLLGILGAVNFAHAIPYPDKFCPVFPHATSVSGQGNVFYYGHPNIQCGGKQPAANVYALRPGLYCLNSYNGTNLANYPDGPYLSIRTTQTNPVQLDQFPTRAAWNSVGGNYSGLVDSQWAYTISKMDPNVVGGFLPWSAPITSLPYTEENLLDFNGCAFRPTAGSPSTSSSSNHLQVVDYVNFSNQHKFDAAVELVYLFDDGVQNNPVSHPNVGDVFALYNTFDEIFDSTLYTSPSGADANGDRFYNTNVPLCGTLMPTNCVASDGTNNFSGWKNLHNPSWCCKNIAAIGIQVIDPNPATPVIVDGSSMYACNNEFLNRPASPGINESPGIDNSIPSDEDFNDVFDMVPGQKCFKLSAGTTNLEPYFNPGNLAVISATFAGTVGVPLNFTLPSAIDPESDPLTYSVFSGAATGVSGCLGNTNDLTCTITQGTPTTISFSYKAHDGLNQSSNMVQVTISITPPNNPPVCLNQVLSVPANMAYNLPLTFFADPYDPDADPITFTGFSGAPAWFNTSCAAGFPSSTCSILNAPSGANVTFNKTYTQGGTPYNCPVTLQVNNGPPTGFALSNITIFETNSGPQTNVVVANSVSDPEGDPITVNCTLASPNFMAGESINSCSVGGTNIRCIYTPPAISVGPGIHLRQVSCSLTDSNGSTSLALNGWLSNLQVQDPPGGPGTGPGTGSNNIVPLVSTNINQGQIQNGVCSYTASGLNITSATRNKRCLEHWQRLERGGAGVNYP